MTQPDTNTYIIILINVLGWLGALWRNSTRNYQHRAMWQEYAERKKIPVNGR